MTTRPEADIKRKLKEIPKFKTEDEEREFWSTQDTTDYFDWDDSAVAVLPTLSNGWMKRLSLSQSPCPSRI